MVPLSQYLLLAALPFTIADGQYRSRPDLAPPKLNITVPAPDANGTEYVFIAPYSESIQQGGAYIYRKDGDLVWSGIGYYEGFVGNFHVTTYHGETVLQGFHGTIDSSHGEGFGQHLILNHNYEHVVSAKTGNHRIPSIHEFNVIDGKTALVEIYIPTLANLSAYGGNASQKWIGDGLFQEFDIETGELIFEWNSLDHVNPSDSLITLNSSPSESGLSATQTWDYIHLNSVDKDSSGNYLLSSRHFSTIFKINGSDDSIIWQLGGNHSTFTYNFTFGFQHHARWHHQSETTEIISFFDNSGDGSITFNNVSRALIVELDHTTHTATILRKATAPYNLQAASQGNAQLLPNDHIFVNWGSAGAITEFDANNKVIYHAFIENAVSYRGFLGNWTGTPYEVPAITAYVDSDGTIRLYGSWNGDTETKEWRFYRAGEGNSTFLGAVERKSFETSLLWVDERGYYAEAVGVGGRVLAKTHSVVATKYISV
ncbi:arylsulfotransferase [Aspergillus sclerotioniger CBS 115572]|uniref:Arylsulfotransferase n=1 Tax=Aspergillus sclerotioniger CBS 115572 TaxID=1450535 RepID=A0A317X5T2_9EURO|nr:arylsulfotransferase [Aspergillus sclerotioniger CBS 115572]PWY92982.1 arylsulfotransferase [Aspergillus sclerotioniger CBS 115572]